MTRAEPPRIREIGARGDDRLKLALDELRRGFPSTGELGQIERAIAMEIRTEGNRARTTWRRRTSGSMVSAIAIAVAAAAAAVFWLSTSASERLDATESTVQVAQVGRRQPSRVHASDSTGLDRGSSDAVASEQRPRSKRTVVRHAQVRVARTSHVAEPRVPAPLASAAFDPIEEGRVNINSIPITAVVLDGRPLGGTPRLGVTVPPGEHTVLFVHPQRGRRSIRVNVDPGGTVLAAIRF